MIFGAGLEDGALTLAFPRVVGNGGRRHGDHLHDPALGILGKLTTIPRSLRACRILAEYGSSGTPV